MTPGELETRIRETWDFDDPDASAAEFQQHADQASGDEEAIWLTQVARADGLAGRFDEGHAILDSLDAPNLGAHGQARVAIERGRLLNSAGNPAEAQTDFGRAYDLASRAGLYGLAVDALHMTAIVVGQINGPEAATATNLAALELAQAAVDDPNATRWVPSLLNNLGWNQHELGDFEGALDLFERALEARRAQDSSPAELLAAENAVAQARRSLDTP